jgi:hypothetical protein
MADSTHWTGALNVTNPADIVLMLQAVNGVGEVAMNNNNGYYFTPGVTPGASLPPSANAYGLQLAGATSGTYLGTANVTATLTETATNNPNGGVANQPVTFSFGPTTVTASTNSGGVAAATIPLIEPPGTYSLAASYAGDSNNQPAVTQGNIQINKATTALTLSAPAQITSGTNSGATATLTSGGSPLAQKSVYFVVSHSGTVVGTSVGITNSHGVAQAGTIKTTAGSVGSGYTMTAYFGSGTTPLPNGGSYNATDLDYLGSTTSGSPVGLADATATSLSAAPNPAVFGQSVTLTATVSTINVNGSASPPNGYGTVAFSQGNTPIGSCSQQPLSSGQATCTVTGLAVGPYTFSATYSGFTGAYLTSTSPSTNDNVNKASTATTLNAPSSAKFGTPITLTATVQPVAPGAGTPTGSVSFYDGANLLGSTALNQKNPDTASLTVTIYQGGNQSLSAQYAGDGSFSGSTGNASTSVTFSQTISGTFSGSLTVNSGQFVLITGTVNGSVTVNTGGGLEVNGGTIVGSASSTGAVAFTLCNATLDSSLSVSSSTGFVFIGGGTGSGCAASSIAGSTSISKNTGGVELANSTFNSSVSVSNNSGPSSQNGGLPPEPAVAGNSIAGALSCSKNTPNVTNLNQPNTSPNKSGQCTTL